MPGEAIVFKSAAHAMGTLGGLMGTAGCFLMLLVLVFVTPTTFGLCWSSECEVEHPKPETKYITNTVMNPSCSDDLYADIVSRGKLNIAYPGSRTGGLIGMATDAQFNLYPTGYFGGIVKAVVICVFGEYRASYIGLLPTSNEHMWSQAYNGTADLVMNLPVISLESQLAQQFNKYTAATGDVGVASEHGFAFSAAFMSFNYGLQLDNRYDADCTTTPSDCSTMKGKLLKAMLAKKLFNGATTYTIAAPTTGSTAEKFAQLLVSTWGEELKTATNVELYAGSASSALDASSLGTFQTMSASNGTATLGSDVSTTVDALVLADWEALVNGGATHSIVASNADVAADGFLGAYDSYGFLLPANKQTQLLGAAVQTAMFCLARAEALNIHSLTDFNAASSDAQAELSKTYGQNIAGGAQVCKKIVEEVGSLQTLRNLVTLSGYSLDTSRVGQL